MKILRVHAATLESRLKGPRHFIQVIAGPRQVGKTTLVHQVLDSISIPVHYVSADEAPVPDATWLRQHWDIARTRAGTRGGVVLAIDEIQKIPAWSTTIKGLWDADSRTGMRIKVVLLGSSPLLLQTGLDESLAGRFEMIRMQQWSFVEMEAAFRWDLPTYLFHGGYPGAAALIADLDRWRGYVRDSLVETTVARDVVQLERVNKPALLRRLFDLGSAYSGQELSFTKMLGQLHDAGNSTTLSHYAELLSAAGVLSALQKYSGHAVRRRSSTPKWLVHDSALLTASLGISRKQAQNDPALWGRIVETAVGSYLLRAARDDGFELYYWRDGNSEVDFVARRGSRTTAVEVKSGRPRRADGMGAFYAAHKPDRMLLVGSGRIELAEFFAQPASQWLA